MPKSWNRLHQGLAYTINRALPQQNRYSPRASTRNEPTEKESNDVSEDEEDGDVSSEPGDLSIRARDLELSSNPVRPPSTYPQVPIDADREIRIIQLLPGFHWEDIRCNVRVCTLDESVDDDEDARSEESSNGDQNLQSKFEALSYTWGSWADPKSISFAGVERQFPVTQNLWAALKRLRGTKHVRELWIDQLSINQDDRVEKAKQVVLMGKIYHQADQMVIWLGDVPNAPHGTSPPMSQKECREQLRQAIIGTTPSWFTRAWVLQEFVMARNEPKVCFGPHELDWSEFLAVFMPTSTTKMLLSGRTMLKLIMQVIAFVYIRDQSTQRSLLTLAWTMIQLDSSVPKDKVYSLISLLPMTERSLIPVDYRVPDAMIFAQATYAAITQNDNLIFLSFCFQRAQLEMKLPSWVVCFEKLSSGVVVPDEGWAVDWGKNHRQAFMQAVLPANMVDGQEALVRIGTEPYYWSLNQAQDELRAKMSFDRGRLTLTVRGLVFDRIGQVMPEENYKGMNFWKRVVSEAWNHEDEKYLNCMAELLPNAYQNVRQRTKEFIPTMHCKACNSPLTKLAIFAHIRRWESATKSKIESAGGVNLKFYQDIVVPFGSSFNKLFTTQAGFFASGPMELEVGDSIILPYESRFPAILRESENGTWKFLGFAYVFGIMQGELIEEVADFELEERDFILS